LEETVRARAEELAALPLPQLAAMKPMVSHAYENMGLASPSEGLPVWSRHVGDPILASNRTRRIDFALFMVDALTNDELIGEAPAIVGCRTPSAVAGAPG